MAILNNNPLVGASGNQGGYNINNSLRFRGSASAYLSRTPASATNRKTYTFSVWVKRGQLNTGNSNKPPHIIRTSSPETAIRFEEATDADKFRVYSLGTGGFSYHSSAVYRDCSAWYHIVVAVDTTQATASNRVKIYINGSQITAFSSATDPSQNYEGGINNNTAHAIGAAPTPTEYFDGYMAEVNFIDGLQLTPSDFGSTNSTTGVWQPKKYTGSYGTNGYYLPFSDIATTSGSNAGLGKDFSGNSNYWTTNNISVTAGTTYDAMTDSPTNTSATVANYCTLNPLSTTTGTYSNANLRYASADTWRTTNSTISVSTGKWYFEVTLGNAPSSPRSGGSDYNAFGFGLSTAFNSTNFLSGSTDVIALADNGYYKNFSGTYTDTGVSFSSGNVLAIAVDLDANTFTFYRNNTSLATGTIGGTVGRELVPIIMSYNASYGVMDVNFGQRPFSYTPPTGFVALNTFNLPTPTILQGNKYMDATLYTGTGSSLNVTGVNFQPDFVWIKERVGAADHGLYDAVRGVQKQLESNTTTAETTETTGLTAFNSNGFTVGALAQLNTNTDTYVGWSWKANGAGSSNTSGSITSTVSVNTTAGFSIVTYTGNGTAGATVGHGLGVAPKMIIVKWRSSAGGSWATWHSSFVTASNTDYLLLDSTLAKGGAGSLLLWNNTAPTSSVFSIGTNIGVNTNTGTYVAYCWAEIAGFSRFGSYTGNSSSDGPFVYTGFRPKFVMVKRSSSTGPWEILDSSRNTFNVTQDGLRANASDAEINGIGPFDFLSNGFKLRGLGGVTNDAGTFIYAAFAENPFKNSLAR